VFDVYLDTDYFSHLQLNVLHCQKHTSNVRIGVVHNFDAEEVTKSVGIIPWAVEAALELLDTSTAKNFITKLLKEENVEALKSGQKSLDDLAVSVSSGNEKVSMWRCFFLH
jgi:hypothetical protein